MGIEVQGARELRRTLKAAGVDLGDLKASHKQAATIAAHASAALAPKKSGRLAATIRASGTTTAGIIRTGTKAVPYAPAVHWGRHYWPNRSHARRTRSEVRAQPFLSDGATSSEGRWLPIYEHTVEKALAQIKGK